MSQRNANHGKGVLSRQEIYELTRDPMMRWPDVPGGDMLAEQAILHPDTYLEELVGLVAQDQMSAALLSGDPFWPNYPPLGALPPLVPGRLPIAGLMSTQELFSMPVLDLDRNLLLCGPTGSGKTSWLRVMLLACLAHDCLVVAFDRKQGELIDCQALVGAGLPVFVLRADRPTELPIAMLQPPGNIPTARFATSIVELIASTFHLWASRRLLFDTLTTLYRRPRPPGQWPFLSFWIAMIEAIRVHAVSRVGQYREACLYVLNQMSCELGQSLNHSSSNLFERILSRRGCVVILTEGLSVDMASFLAGLFINYAYHARTGVAVENLRQLVFVLDDSLPLLKGSAWESEGGSNPLAEFAFMSRSRKIGFVASVQNFARVSEAFRNNAQSILCFGSYGRDAAELARHLNLTPEQAALLPTLRPGQLVGCCRSVWPHAVLGLFPKVP